MMDAQSKGKALGRLRRIEGQVQGIQRMVEEDKYCVDILLQLTAVQGAVEQVQKLLLGQHLETCARGAPVTVSGSWPSGSTSSPASRGARRPG